MASINNKAPKLKRDFTNLQKEWDTPVINNLLEEISEFSCMAGEVTLQGDMATITLFGVDIKDKIANFHIKLDLSNENEPHIVSVIFFRIGSWLEHDVVINIENDVVKLEECLEQALKELESTKGQ